MFDQILDLVGQPPGSLVYHFLILFAVEAAVAISMGQWTRERDAGTLRLTIAAFGLFLGRVVLLLASLAAWQGYIPRNVLLPPVERLVDTITVLGLAWAFVTMDAPEVMKRRFTADVAALVTLGVSLILFGGALYFWSSDLASNLLFNGSWLDVLWAALQIAIAIGGLVWMLARIRYLYDPFLKGTMLVILAAAAALQVVRPSLGDVPAAMRLGQALVIPMLAAVAYRHVVERLLHWDDFEPSRLAGTAALPGGQVGIAAADDGEMPPPGLADETVRSRPLREEELDAEAEPSEAPAPAHVPVTPALLETVDALGGLLGTLDASKILDEAPRAVATALRADICALAIVDQDVQEAAILGGYDNIAQIPLRHAVLNLAHHPTLVNALGRLRQMRLTDQRQPAELQDIYRKLHISHEGPAYLQPLVNGDERVGVLIVGSPYSGRHLTDEERNLLDRLGPLVTASLLNAEAHRAMQDKAEKAVTQEANRIVELADDVTAKTAELNAARRQIEEMKDYIRQLHRQVEELPAQQQAAQRQIEKLLGEVERLRERADEAERLREQLDGMREAMAAPAAVGPVSEGEVAALRARLAAARISEQEVGLLQEQLAARTREVVKLQSRLAEAEAVADALREQLEAARSAGRQAPPAAELEALQARLVEQAQVIAGLEAQLAAAEAGLHALDAAHPPLAPEPVDVIDAVEETITRLAGHFTRKGLTLRLAAPAALPPVVADRAALLDVVNSLLANAALASPADGEVALSVALGECELPCTGEATALATCLALDVADSGPGVDPADYERVFAHRYEPGRSLIEGLGTGGVSLPLVRTLVEAHGGCVWLESKKGAGTTFRVRLPLEPLSGEGES